MQSIFQLLALAGLVECVINQHPITLQAIPGQPLLGFGTWNLKESSHNTSSAVSIAIETGYRQIDCAAAYGNEKAVGEGIAKGLKKAGVRREDIWVTSKLWNDYHSPSLVAPALNKTLSDLGLQYLDLYLMHWPVGKSSSSSFSYHLDYLPTWTAMTALLSTGLVRHIGISNFSPAQLEELIANSDIKPAVHQMELHPYLPQEDWVRWHQRHGISVTAYSPLGNMNPTYGYRNSEEKAPLLLENEKIKRIAEKRDCTPAQVVLAWGMNRGTSVIPKSKHEEFVKENFGSRHCLLKEEDLEELRALGKHPSRFNNPSKGWGVHLFEGLDDA